jgi:hypothetical protein
MNSDELESKREYIEENIRLGYGYRPFLSNNDTIELLSEIAALRAQQSAADSDERPASCEMCGAPFVWCTCKVGPVDALDAPDHYTAAEAEAWAEGRNSALVRQSAPAAVTEEARRKAIAAIAEMGFDVTSVDVDPVKVAAESRLEAERDAHQQRIDAALALYGPGERRALGESRWRSADEFLIAIRAALTAPTDNEEKN